MGQKKIVLDTNILISALGWKGNPHLIFQHVVNGVAILVTSHDQMGELKRVLDYPKFKFTGEHKAKFLSLVSTIATIVDTPRKISVIRDDPADNILLELAVAGGAWCIVSGDEHLLTLKEFEGIRILTPSQFLKLRDAVKDEIDFGLGRK